MCYLMKDHVFDNNFPITAHTNKKLDIWIFTVCSVSNETFSQTHQLIHKPISEQLFGQLKPSLCLDCPVVQNLAHFGQNSSFLIGRWVIIKKQHKNMNISLNNTYFKIFRICIDFLTAETTDFQSI